MSSEQDTGPGAHDARRLRCKRLGHEIPFGYCRVQPATEAPCPEILNCWWQTFDVAVFLRRHLSPEVWQGLTQPTAQPKVVRILDLIEQARQRTGRPG